MECLRFTSEFTPGPGEGEGLVAVPGAPALVVPGEWKDRSWLLWLTTPPMTGRPA